MCTHSSSTYQVFFLLHVFHAEVFMFSLFSTNGQLYLFSYIFLNFFFSFTSKSLSRFTHKKKKKKKNIFVKFLSRVPHIFDQIVIINPSKSIRPTLSTHSKSMDSPYMFLEIYSNVKLEGILGFLGAQFIHFPLTF